MGMRALAVGDRIRRIKDGRTFEITYINHRGEVPVFTADSRDGKWSNWGGPLSQLRYGETFEMAGVES